MTSSPQAITGSPAEAGRHYVGPVLRHDDDRLRQEVEPGQYVIHERAALGDIPDAVFNPTYRQNGSEDIYSRWINSWSIAYGGDGTAKVEPAALLLIVPDAVYPNKFDGPIVTETSQHLIQFCGYELFVAHPKALVGALQRRTRYSVRYSGMNCQAPTVHPMRAPKAHCAAAT